MFLAMQTQASGSILPPERCSECGFESSQVVPEHGAETVRSLGPRFRQAMTIPPGADPEAVRWRADPLTWSALEYTAHVRDLIALWGSALHLALTQDHASIPRPDPDLPDRTASEQSYNAQDPATVTEQLTANAERMARKVTGMGADAWGRQVLIGDAEMTALDIVRKVAHEGLHHLQDVKRALDSPS